jgi:hypothetical protein
VKPVQWIDRRRNDTGKLATLSWLHLGSANRDLPIDPPAGREALLGLTIHARPPARPQKTAKHYSVHPGSEELLHALTGNECTDAWMI